MKVVKKQQANKIFVSLKLKKKKPKKNLARGLAYDPD